MKKILTIWLILILSLFTKNIYAEEINNIDTNEIINEQEKELRNIRIYKRIK